MRPHKEALSNPPAPARSSGAGILQPAHALAGRGAAPQPGACTCPCHPPLPAREGAAGCPGVRMINATAKHVHVSMPSSPPLRRCTLTAHAGVDRRQLCPAQNTQRALRCTHLEHELHLRHALHLLPHPLLGTCRPGKRNEKKRVDYLRKSDERAASKLGEEAAGH